ncbi:MAG TPA: protein kinase [Polyangiaceae bacterium]|nr:protein kinase [Polyangiaceae bacterium]
MDETLNQIGSGQDAAGGVAPEAASDGRAARATACPLCGQQFSADGRFCPFDGEPLRPVAERAPVSDPLLGSVVDERYEIVALLGEGGMGIVYCARHCALGKRFALKALRKDLATDREIAARFMQEARTAASISHPGLVEIIDFGKLHTGQPYFVMELLEGQSLAQLVRRGGPLPAARAIDIVRQIADALGAAHERSIVHRDLKPDNIHVSPAAAGRDRVTIVDFGLAKVMGASRLTRAGMVFGTPHYMSPEQAQGDPTDHRADIYALGVVMYEMFTGRVPFEADSYMGVLTKHMYMEPTPPSKLVGIEKLGVLEDIILRCLEKKPDYRYQTMRELRADLDLALDPGGPRRLPARKRRGTPRPLLADELELPSSGERRARLAASLESSWPWWPLTIIGGLFLAGIAGMLAFRSFVSAPRAQARRASESARVVGSQPLTVKTASALPGPPPPLETRAVLSAAPAQSTAPVPAPGSEPHPAAKAAAVTSGRASVARAPAQPAPRLSARTAVSHAAPTAEKKPLRPSSTEIVDPWAK